MKKKNMIKFCKNIFKIKSAMIDRWSVIDNEDLLRDLIENVADVEEKDIDNMVETVLYLIENEDCFIKEVENGIIKNVKKLLYIDGKVLTLNDMILLLYSNNVLINDINCDDLLLFKRNVVHGLEKDMDRDGKYHNSLVIPCTSDIQKYLFIEFELLTDRELEPLLKDITDIEVDIIMDINIKITDIYIYS